MALIVQEDASSRVLVDTSRVGGMHEDAQGRVFADPAMTGGLFWEDEQGRVYGRVGIHGEKPVATVGATATRRNITQKRLLGVVSTSATHQKRVNLSPRHTMVGATATGGQRRVLQRTLIASVGASAYHTRLPLKRLVSPIGTSVTERKLVSKRMTAVVGAVGVHRKITMLSTLRATVGATTTQRKIAHKRLVTAVGTTATSKKVTRKILRAFVATPALLLGAPERIEGLALQLGRYLRGRMGHISPRPKLWISNKYGEEIRPAKTVRSASVSLNNAREYTFELSLNMEATDDFDPKNEYLLPTIDYYNSLADTYERWPLGLYRVMHPNLEVLEATQFWEFQGASLEQLVSEKMAVKGYSVLPNTLILAKVREILTTQFAIPESMIEFPPAAEDQRMRGYRIFDIREDTDGCYWLNIINEILSAGGFTKLQTTATGKFRVRKITDPRNRTPDIVYGYLGDNIIAAESALRIERDSSEFANHILVTSNNALLPPIVARAINTNPDSPSSVQNLKREKVKHIPLPDLVNASAAQAIADAELARRSGVNEKLVYQTPIDPRRAYPSEVAEIELDDINGEILVEGNWLYEGWSANMDPATTMEHSVQRLADI